MKQPKEILEQWMYAVNHTNIENLLSLYDKEAILIPTFSNRILNSSDKHREYFEKLSCRDGLNIRLHENTLIIQTLQDNIYILSGIYNWCFKVDGEMLNFEAHFTYFIDLSKDHPIIHHHSSQIPRML